MPKITIFNLCKFDFKDLKITEPEEAEKEKCTLNAEQ